MKSNYWWSVPKRKNWGKKESTKEQNHRRERKRVPEMRFVVPPEVDYKNVLWIIAVGDGNLSSHLVV